MAIGIAFQVQAPFRSFPPGARVDQDFSVVHLTRVDDSREPRPGTQILPGPSSPRSWRIHENAEIVFPFRLPVAPPRGSLYQPREAVGPDGMDPGPGESGEEGLLYDLNMNVRTCRAYHGFSYPVEVPWVRGTCPFLGNFIAFRVTLQRMAVGGTETDP